MPKSTHGWSPLKDVASRLGKHPEAVRRLVRAGVFTRGAFTPGVQKSPIWLKDSEVAAYQGGGIDAVKKLRRPGKRATA